MLTDETFASIPENIANQCRSFVAAAKAIHSIAGEGAGDSTLNGSEGRAVQLWAQQSGFVFPFHEFETLELISNSTSEHEVRFRESDNRVLKQTWPGVYGQIPAVIDGKLDRRNATPVEYLYRMALQCAVFASDLRLEGACVTGKSMVLFVKEEQPSFFISQPWFMKAGVVKKHEIDAFMAGEGFIEIKGTYFGWYRPQDRVAVVDAKPDNFIVTEGGIVALDLQISLISEQEELAASLPSCGIKQSLIVTI